MLLKQRQRQRSIQEGNSRHTFLEIYEYSQRDLRCGYSKRIQSLACLESCPKNIKSLAHSFIFFFLKKTAWKSSVGMNFKGEGIGKRKDGPSFLSLFFMLKWRDWWIVLGKDVHERKKCSHKKDPNIYFFFLVYFFYTWIPACLISVLLRS